MVVTAEDIFFLFKSKARRVEEEVDRFYHTFVKRNRAYKKDGSHENAGIVAIAAIFFFFKERKEQAPDKERNVEKL